MEITQLKAALAQSLTIRNSGPDASQVAAFNDKLSAARVAPLPESTLVKSLQTEQANLVKGIEESKSVSVLSPASALAAQYGLANSVVGIDLVAKVAGTFSQGINKLVAMQ